MRERDCVTGGVVLDDHPFALCLTHLIREEIGGTVGITKARE